MDKCPTSGEAHDIESFMVESIPPSTDVIEACAVNEFDDADNMAKVIVALSKRRYLVACKACGLVLGGFADKAQTASVPGAE